MANAYIQDVLAQVRARNGHEAEFLQAVAEVLETLEPAVNADAGTCRKTRFLNAWSSPSG